MPKYFLRGVFSTLTFFFFFLHFASIFILYIQPLITQRVYITGCLVKKWWKIQKEVSVLKKKTSKIVLLCFLGILSCKFWVQTRVEYKVKKKRKKKKKVSVLKTPLKNIFFHHISCIFSSTSDIFQYGQISVNKHINSLKQTFTTILVNLNDL